MCWLCEASSVNLDMLWTGLGPDAGWRRTRWSHEAYFAYLTAPVIVAPLLLAIVTGFRLDCWACAHCQSHSLNSSAKKACSWMVQDAASCLVGAAP